MAETIRVGIADMKICEAPDKITTIGLGSCIGIVLYSNTSKVAGLVHIMLPDSTRIRQNDNKCKFADTGVDELIRELEQKGINKSLMKAKIAGGAKMFQFNNNSEMGSIGDKNIEAVKTRLKMHGIKIVSEDVGLNFGRTIVFDPETQELTVITAGKLSHVI